MMKYLRMVANRRHWERPKGAWLALNDLPADAITQIRTSDNALSVYQIENTEQANKVIIALAKKRREPISPFDYALIEDRFTQDAKIKVIKSQGETMDSEVNDWHFDFVELDEEKALALADYLMQGNTYRLQSFEMRNLLPDS